MYITLLTLLHNTDMEVCREETFDEVFNKFYKSYQLNRLYLKILN